MDPKWLLPEAMKQAQWEIAKGHLRALVTMQGSYSSGGRFPGEEMSSTERVWRELEARVEAFIKSVEDDSLHE